MEVVEHSLHYGTLARTTRTGQGYPKVAAGDAVAKGLAIQKRCGKAWGYR